MPLEWIGAIMIIAEVDRGRQKKVEEKDTEDKGDDVLLTQNLHHSQQ